MLISVFWPVSLILMLTITVVLLCRLAYPIPGAITKLCFPSREVWDIVSVDERIRVRETGLLKVVTGSSRQLQEIVRYAPESE